MQQVKKSQIVVTEENELLEPVGLPKKKKVDKPWILYFKIVDEKIMGTNSWFNKNLAPNIWLKDSWMKFVSIDNGLRELNKLGRSYNFKQNPMNLHWQFAGKEFKLINSETREEKLLEITESEVKLK